MVNDPLSSSRFREEITKSLNANFAEWRVMPPSVWAEEVRRMKGGIRFKWDYAPYLRKMFDSIFDPNVQETSFQLFSRAGKSEVVLNAIGWCVDQQPRRILSLWPTNSNGEKWSKDNLVGELFDETPALHHLGSKASKRTGGNTLLHKIFPGGLIDIFGANAPGDMRRAKGNFLYGDEIDAIGSESTDEGDQMAIFNKRGDEFSDTIRVFASYPSLLGYSKIHAKILDSDFQQYFVHCQKCGDEFIMHRRHLRYDPDAPECAMMECPNCTELLNDAKRYDMMIAGDWRATREFRGRRGFQANAMLWPHPVDCVKYPGGFLQMLAQQEIAANKSENPHRAMRVLVNTVDAEPFDPLAKDEQPPDHQMLYERREEYVAEVPARGLVLTAFVDVQINRLECGWYAWGRGAECFAIDHRVIDGNTRSWEPWDALRKELARKFKHESGAPIALTMAHIDGGWNADWVFAFLKKLAASPVEGVTGKVRASKGIGKHGHPIIDTRFSSIAKNLKGHHIGTWAAKDTLYLRLRMKPGEDGTLPDGWIHFPKHFEPAWFEQLCSERVTITVKGADEIRKYENPEKKRNEALDILVGNFAAYHRRTRWNFDLIEMELNEAAALLKTPMLEDKPDPVSDDFQVGGMVW